MMENCEANYCKKEPCETEKCASACEDETCMDADCEKGGYGECKRECYGSGNSMVEDLLCLSEEAYNDLMMDKIKAHIERINGKKMDATAQAVAEAAHLYWTKKIAKKEADPELEEAYGKILKSMSSD